MLEISHIDKRFDKTVALRDVVLKIEPGRVTGILGQSGAGKTTLLRIIGGLLRPDNGSVLLDGVPVGQKDIGLLMGGDVGLYHKLTARENIQYFADLHDMDKKTAADRIEQLAELFSLTPYLDRKAEELSRGTRQKVSIIRAVVHDPKLILFDEPETGLDFEAAQKINDFLTGAAKEGKTVLYSSHSVGNILASCFDAYILHLGRVIDYRNVEEIQREYTSAQAQDMIYRMVCVKDSGREGDPV